MYPQKSQVQDKVSSETYPLGEQGELLFDGRAMALVALSHTHLEHSIYLTMLSETSTRSVRFGLFSTRQLMTLTSIRSSSTLRRGLEGLIAKLSIERQGNGRNGNGEPGKQYLVRSPEEILARRAEMGVALFPREVRIREGNQYFERARSSSGALLCRRLDQCRNRRAPERQRANGEIPSAPYLYQVWSQEK